MKIGLRVIYGYAFLLLLVFSSCGRKRRNIFSFAQKEKAWKHTLDFPAVKEVFLLSKDQRNHITWAVIVWKGKLQEHFLGYNIYSLNSWGVVSKKPLNKVPIKANKYIDFRKNNNNRKRCYLVRAVFSYKNKVVQGPASQIICSK